MEISGRHLPLKIAAPVNKVLHNIGKFSKVHTTSQFAHGFRPSVYMYVYIMKLCRQQTEVVQNHEHEQIRILDKAKLGIENMRGLNLAAVQLTTVQETKLPL
jgi:hypothetical protein